MAYIEMVHSFKRYHMGDIIITANNDVSFDIERGELAIILGSSGAGKSTVLNILGGIDTNSEGKVIIDGVDISWIVGLAVICPLYYFLMKSKVKDNPVTPRAVTA